MLVVLGELGDRDVPITPLIGTHDGGLPSAAGANDRGGIEVAINKVAAMEELQRIEKFEAKDARTFRLQGTWPNDIVQRGFPRIQDGIYILDGVHLEDAGSVAFKEVRMIEEANPDWRDLWFEIQG